MKTYHKINTIFKRNKDTHKIIVGDFSCEEFKYLKDNQWVFTEKVDGTNIRIMFDGETIKYGGKTDNAQLHVDLVENLRKMFESNLELFKETFENKTDNPTAICLYGEGYGAGIQKGGCYRGDKSFVLFDIKAGENWLERENVEDIANKFGIDVVPTIGEGTISEMIEMAKKGFNSQWGDFIAEGIVARPKTEMRARRGDRIITKIKHKDFN